MQKFITLSGVAAPMPIINIDTDMIIPKQFLKTIKRTGLGKNLFDEMRFTQDGKEIPEFILNQPGYRESKIVVAGENFGCGSSREHAPWALLDFGIRSIIAPSFADIFYNNCFKNGILPVKLPKEQVEEITQVISHGGPHEITVDLNEKQVRAGNKIYPFEVDEFRQYTLLNGLDDIGLTLQHAAAIDAFEQKNAGSAPWLYAKR